MKSVRVIHPFLFTLYPLLITISFNFWQVSSWDILRLMFFVFLICCLLFLLFQIIVKDWQRAGFLTSIAVILLIYLDYSKYIPEKIYFASIRIDRYWVIILLWVLILIFANSKLFWGRIRPNLLTRFFNITAIILIGLSIISLWTFINSYVSDPLRGWSSSENSNIEENVLNPGSRPDIYYIIVDGYARNDVLQEIYNFDNSDFINYLEDQGFYVAEESQSNYLHTPLSLSSSLNFDYIDNLGISATNSDNREPLKKLTHHSKVRSILENNGYDVITLSSGYYITEIKDSDLYLSLGHSYFSALEILFFETTGFHIILDSINLNSSISGYETHRRRILHEFEQLENIPTLSTDRPKFVFAHLLLPHTPLIFDQNGAPVSEDRPFSFTWGNARGKFGDELIRGYTDQVIFTNKMLKRVIESILSNSKSAPIIIVQADHGPGFFYDWEIEQVQDSCLKERFSIFNVYFLPQDSNLELYPSITPVNTFRIIFDSVFGTDFGRLPDINYFSRWEYFYDFVDVTSQSQLPCEIGSIAH